MDATRSSRKRKQFCLSPLHPPVGIFTRSKSQFFLHQNRSGKARSDPPGRETTHASSNATCGKNQNQPFLDDDNDDDMLLIKDLGKKIKLNRENEISIGDNEEISNALIKDLRARRVYSPQSVDGPCCKLIPDVKSSCGDEKLADLGFGLSSTTEIRDPEDEAAEGNKENEKLGDGFSLGQNKNDINSILCSIANEYRSDKDNDLYVDDIMGKDEEETKTSDVELSCKAQNLDHEDSKSFAEISKLQDSDGNNNGGTLEQIVEMKEVVQTTPPDAEILEANRYKGNQVDRVFQDMTPMAEENSGEGFPTKTDKGNNSVLGSKSVLKSHLQRKLFKTPGSVSYRRLLPFLMNITKDESGTPKLGHCQKDEKGVDAKQFQLPLPSRSQEASSGQLKTNSCSTRSALVDITLVDGANELSYGNDTKSASCRDISVLPLQSDAKEVAYNCLSLPAASQYTAEAEIVCKGKCFNDSTAVASVDFHCVKAVASAVNNDDFNLDSKNSNDHSAHADVNNDRGTTEQVGDFNDQCVLMTPPDPEICHNSEVNVIEGNQVEKVTQGAYPRVKDTDLTPQENGEGICPEPDNRNGSIFKSKSVLEPRWQRRLFITPGSVNYRRLLPYLKDIGQDDSGTPTLHPCQKDEKSMYGRGLELPLSSEIQAGSRGELKADSCSVHDTVESSAMADITLVNPANELSHGDEPKLMVSQGIPELPMQVDAENVTQKCMAVTSTNERIEEVEIICKGNSLSGSRVHLCLSTDDFCCAKNVANSLQNEEFKQVKSQNSESLLAPEAQNLLHMNPDTSSITCEEFSSEEKQPTLDSDERKQVVSPDKSEPVGRYSSEAQTINHIDSKLSEASNKNKTGSHANSRNGDALVLNLVHVPNKDPALPLDFSSLKSSDAPEKGYKAEILQEGSANGLRMMLSKGSNEDSSSCVGKIRNGSESKTTLVLNPCSQIKLLKTSGSFNYRRLLPFLMNITKHNSCALGNDHSLRFEKHLDLTPHPPISASSSPVTPVDLNGGVCTEHCSSNSTNQQTARSPDLGKSLYDNVLDLRSSADVPELQSSNYSDKVTELQNGEVVYNGNIKSRGIPDLPVSVRKMDSPVTCSFPIVKEVFSSEDVKSASLQSSVYSKVKGKNSIVICEEQTLETDEYCRNLSQPKVSDQSRIPAVGFKKGILKRNPRGCRGLCTCLNCATFRLHAERAFEFSRNQLLDAEELALDLVKEVSYLRSMLERTTQGANDHSALEINQVKEACRRASAAEQLAKDRLSELNDDLNIHCRITCLQQPRVRFANRVEERIIPQEGQK